MFYVYKLVYKSSFNFRGKIINCDYILIIGFILDDGIV